MGYFVSFKISICAKFAILNWVLWHEIRHGTITVLKKSPYPQIYTEFYFGFYFMLNPVGPESIHIYFYAVVCIVIGLGKQI